MTIDILFKTDDELVLRVNMSFPSFLCKILDELPEDEREKWTPEFIDRDNDKTFTDKEFIERVWYGCLRHGYISENHDIMGKFLDKMEVQV